MIENFLRPPRSPAEWTADVLRGAGVLSILVALVCFAPTDAGIVALASPALMAPRFAGVAAWFDIACGAMVLLAAWSNVFDLYTTVPGWDIVVHLACTGALAVLVYVLLGRWRVIPEGRRPAREPIALIPLIGLAISAVWEMLEWAGFVFVTDQIFVAYDDTIGDMAAGGLGSLIAGIVLIYAPVVAPGPSGENRFSGSG